MMSTLTIEQPRVSPSVSPDCSEAREERELLQKNLHTFWVIIEDYGDEAVVFQGLTREEAKRKFDEWLENEPHIKAL